MLFKGHTGSVSAVDFFPDGRRIASASRDATIRVWDMKSGQQIGKSLTHNTAVCSIAISRDGGRIASGLSNGRICVWDVSKGEMVHGPLEGHATGVLSLAFSPDDRLIASGGADKMIGLWDTERGSAVGILKGHYTGVSPVVFSPDGTQLASAGDLVLAIFDVATRTAIGVMGGHRNSVLAVVYSSDGGRLISSSSDHNIRIHNAKTGEPIRESIETSESIYSLAISADGRQLVGAGDTVRVWDIETGKEVKPPLSLGGGSGPTLSPNGRSIASCSENYTIQLRDTQVGADDALLDISAVSPQPTQTRRPTTPPIASVRRRRNSRDDGSSLDSILDLPATGEPQPSRRRERKGDHKTTSAGQDNPLLHASQDAANGGHDSPLNVRSLMCCYPPLAPQLPFCSPGTFIGAPETCRWLPARLGSER
ncbi:WD40 repeat-like protein [Leucogyrophana mollusca]|uniref:WD40 repeat-like protein n=1 Tax=Leucogyrophana mollusca TaxID=85980 RepID=A0ACB8BVN0_9AGAM|nr:WD40 repeat-like protein [Leucogyrophana mollusca]